MDSQGWKEAVLESGPCRHSEFSRSEKALRRLSTRHREHIPHATLASSCYRIHDPGFCITVQWAQGWPKQRGPFWNNHAPPKFPLKPCFLFSCSGRFEWHAMLLWLSDTNNGFSLFPLLSSTYLPPVCPKQHFKASQVVLRKPQTTTLSRINHFSPIPSSFLA